MSNPSIIDHTEFFGLQPGDRARQPRLARAINRVAPKALALFYDRIARTPEVARFFGSTAMVEHAKGKQLEHWRYLFSHGIDGEYAEKAETIGKVHARIGLEPRWYIGGYASVLDEIIRGIAARSPLGMVDGGRTGRTIGTLVKMALLDMTIALTTYFKEEEDRRLAVIDNLGNALSSLANGDFTHKLEGLPEAYARIEADFENMRQQIGKAMSNVSQAAFGIDTGATEIRQASDDLARRTEQQAASLEEAAAALNDLTTGVNQAASDAVGARASIETTVTEAMAGEQIVSEAIVAMADIQQSSGEIGKIIEVIDGIVFQTNLLALNAGVEAARAGEAGKGFAVVANEVRALAQRAASSANEIKDLVKRSNANVDRGESLVGRSGAAFGMIATKVREVNDLVTSIAGVSLTQSDKLTQVNLVIREMDQMTQQNAAMVEESTAAARSLANEASSLKQLVSDFKVSTSAQGAQLGGADEEYYAEPYRLRA